MLHLNLSSDEEQRLTPGDQHRLHFLQLMEKDFARGDEATVAQAHRLIDRLARRFWPPTGNPLDHHRPSNAPSPLESLEGTQPQLNFSEERVSKDNAQHQFQQKPL